MCIFCKVATEEIPTQYLYESEKVVAFRDLDPQAPSHILVIPRQHFENAAELAAMDSETMSELFGAARSIATFLGLDGYRIVFNTGASAGQSVFHAHLHLMGGRAFAWPPG
jgi:histidine triad (HIT) family protein